MANPNLLAATSILGNRAVAELGTSDTTLFTVPSNEVYKVNSILVSNTDSADRTVSVYLTASSSAYHLAHTINVPANTSLVVVAKDQSFYATEGDDIRASASANAVAGAGLYLICSYEEIS